MKAESSMLLIGIGTAGCTIARGIGRAFGEDLRCLFIDTDDTWHTVSIPRDRFKGSEVAPDKAEAMSIRFFMHRWTKPVAIRVGEISYCDQILPSRINVKNRAK